MVGGEGQQRELQDRKERCGRKENNKKKISQKAACMCVRVHVVGCACVCEGERKGERNANPTYLGSSISTSDPLAYRAGNVQNSRHLRKRRGGEKKTTE